MFLFVSSQFMLRRNFITFKVILVNKKEKYVKSSQPKLLEKAVENENSAPQFCCEP